MNILWTDGVVIRKNELGVVVHFYAGDELVTSLGMSKEMLENLKKELNKERE